MKREKPLFAFILIPFFLFSLSTKLFKIDSNLNQTSRLMQKQIQSPARQTDPSQQEKNVVAKGSLERRAGSTRIEKATHPSSQNNESLKFLIDSSGLTRVERKQERDTSLSRENFIILNEGRPYSCSGRDYAPDQVMVKFKPAVSEEMREIALSAYQPRKIRRIPRLDIYEVHIPEDLSVEEMLYLLERNPDVEYAEPNYIRRLTQVTPNDPLFSEQYALYNSGQEFGPPASPQSGTERADIKAREGWVETLGDETVIIAILDTGVDFNHPDLDDKLLPNGYDYANDDSDPTDDHWHGTHVAGIAAAETNNGEGIAGVAWNCQILPIKVVFVPADPLEDPYALTSWIADGIRYAVDSGAHVINLSVGGSTPAQSEMLAIQYAFDNDVVVVSAAGNDGGAVLYPAAYDTIIMGVAATDFDDQWLSWSNTGPEIDVSAPGETIFSLYPTNLVSPPFLPYAWASGTSASAPHVAGLAALIRSIKPEMSAEDIMNIIRYTADDVNSATQSGKDDFIGYGRINMERALVPIIISALLEKR